MPRARRRTPPLPPPNPPDPHPVPPRPLAAVAAAAPADSSSKRDFPVVHPRESESARSVRALRAPSDRRELFRAGSGENRSTSFTRRRTLNRRLRRPLERGQI